jgi:endonuclease/exonuclease/phosphatase family metal-dependent hydrolase
MILTLLFILLQVPCFAAVQQSVIPHLNQLHQVKNIDPKKYSQSQYKAISDALKHASTSLRVVSYNMLYDRYDNLLPPAVRWKERVSRIATLIEGMHADIICFQELYPKQLTELLSELEDEYFFAGKLPKVDDEPVSEVNGILLRKGRFQCQDATFWYLSDTPNKPSSDPFSTEQKTVAEAHIKDWLTGKDLAVYSTHFSFGSPDSREYAARLLASYLEPISQQKPVILAGDFNTFASRVDDPLLPYHDGRYIMKILTSRGMRDAHETALIGSLGPISTYTNKEGTLLPFQGTGTPGVFLDHIFVGGPMMVLAQAIEPATIDGLHASSHMPVIVDCISY